MVKIYYSLPTTHKLKPWVLFFAFTCKLILKKIVALQRKLLRDQGVERDGGGGGGVRGGKPR